jgi:sporulation-control protein
MVFKKMLRKLGVGGPTVDTVLADPRRRPGDTLTGEVRLVGGDADAEIEHIALSLVIRVAQSQVDFHRVVVAGATRLAAGAERAIPFAVPLPLETPLTEISGHPLPRMELGLRTEVSIAKAVDKGDLDPVIVAPLESQDAVLEAFGELGFLFKSADVEAGRLYGVRQELPFFQEIEFYPPPHYAGRVSEVELSTVASAAGVTVVLEADKRSGRSSAVGRFSVAHDEAVDWTARIGEWLDELANSRTVHAGHGHHQRRGPGMGGMLAGAAAGVVGGMMLGDMLAGDDDSGEEG